MIERTFPTSILNIQLHLLVHLVDEVALAGTVHTRWMFYLERFMKTLKGFVRQKARPEGSMAEGWLVQESCVWISEYLGRVDQDLPLMWSNKDDDRLVGDVPQGQGTQFRMSESFREKVMTYCIANSNEMEKWLAIYEVERQGDATLPSVPTQSWIRKAIFKAKEQGDQCISVEEMDYARGCDWHVSIGF